MTRVIFYVNIADKCAMLARLVQQALNKRNLVTIMAADAQEATALSQALWQVGNSFMPNVLATDALAAMTPVVIDWQEKTLLQDEILINLTDKQLLCFSRFQHLIELVGDDEADKTMARTRYKFYRDRGYEIKSIDQATMIN